MNIDKESLIGKNFDILMPVHCFGNLIKKSALEVDNNIPILWDCAHSFGISKTIYNI